MTMDTNLTCDDILLQGRTLRSLTNAELVELKRNTGFTSSSYTTILNEYNSRLMGDYHGNDAGTEE